MYVGYRRLVTYSGKFIPLLVIDTGKSHNTTTGYLLCKYLDFDHDSLEIAFDEFLEICTETSVDFGNFGAAYASLGW